MSNLNISVKKPGDSFTSSELNEIVRAINSKEDSISGKGLSSNDYTLLEKNKLANLPGETYSKEEINQKISSAGGNIVAKSEYEVGLLRLNGPAGVVNNPVYSKFSLLLNLPKIVNSTKEYILSEEPLGLNIYFSIDSLVVSTGEKLQSEIFYSLYEIIKVYVTENYQTKIVIKCKETVTQDLKAHIHIKYIKPYSQKVELSVVLDSTINANDVQVSVPPLKYNKRQLVSFTTDDANASTFCRVWAGVNGRPVSNEFYHANQLLAGDIPDSIIDTTLEKTLGYTDGCGNERRFTQGIAIWPWCKGNGNVVMMDTVNPVDPTANNTYRFMNPYLQWQDIQEMLKYGVSIYYHNIGTDRYGTDSKVDNVITGLQGDCERAKEKVGRGMKILARPDGNNIYIEAAQKSEQILFSVAESNPGEDILPFSSPDLFDMTGLRFFPTGSADQTEQDVIKAQFQTEYSKTKDQRKWFHFCCHTATLDWVNLLVWFNDHYGKDGSDDIWFATLDEVYEYFYIKKNSIIQKKISDNTLTLTMFIPQGQYFYYPDFTLMFSGITDLNKIVNIVESDNIKGLSKGINEGHLMLNLNLNSNLEALAEEFTSKYEFARTNVNHKDALYFVGLLKPALQAPYLTRINANPNAIVLRYILINSGATTTTNRNVKITAQYSGTPTHYRIGDTSDLSSATWTAYSGGPIDYTLKEGYSSKTIYFQLKNDLGESTVAHAAIEYQEASSEILLTGLTIQGSNSVQVGSQIQFSVSYIPSNTTQQGVSWSSSNSSLAAVDARGNVRGISAGNVIITVQSTANPSISSTKSISVTAASQTQKTAFMGDYPWGMYKKDKVFDNIANIYMSILNPNNTSGIIAQNIYDQNTGEILSGWNRMTNQEKMDYYGLDALDNWSNAENYNPDLSSLYSTKLQYSYAYKYAGVRYPVIGWNVPNGTYKISILSSMTENDRTTNGHIKINNVEQSLPDLSLLNNTQWMEFNIDVTDGKIAIMVYPDIDKRMGLNAVKITKLS